MEHDSTGLIYLPPEIWNVICSFVSTDAALRLCMVSKQFRRLAMLNIDEYSVICQWDNLKSAHLTPNIKKLKAVLSLPSHLTYWSQIPDLFKNLIELDISVEEPIGFRIKKLDGFSKLKNLRRLRTNCWDKIANDVIVYCTKLTSIRSDEVIPDSQLELMTQLKEYVVVHRSYRDQNLSKLSYLEKLKLPLTELVHGVQTLQNLRVIGIPQVRKVIEYLPNLERVIALDDAKAVFDDLLDRSRVTHLGLPQARNFQSFQGNLTNLTQLRSLQAISPEFLVEDIVKMTWLTKLKIYSNEDLFEKIVQKLTNLKYLSYDSPYYKRVSCWDLTKLQNLETFQCSQMKISNGTLENPLENFRRILTNLQNLKRVNVGIELDYMALRKLDWRPIEELIVNHMRIWVE